LILALERQHEYEAGMDKKEQDSEVAEIPDVRAGDAHGRQVRGKNRQNGRRPKEVKVGGIRTKASFAHGRAV